MAKKYSKRKREHYHRGKDIFFGLTFAFLRDFINDVQTPVLAQVKTRVCVYSKNWRELAVKSFPSYQPQRILHTIYILTFFFAFVPRIEGEKGYSLMRNYYHYYYSRTIWKNILDCGWQFFPHVCFWSCIKPQSIIWNCIEIIRKRYLILFPLFET